MTALRRSRSPAPATLLSALLLLLLHHSFSPASAWRPWPYLYNQTNTTAGGDPLIGDSKKYEGSSTLVHLRYHMGPVLTANITVHPIWYGSWLPTQKRIIRSFLASISAASSPTPSVAGWWSTVRLYTDQTGDNITRTLTLGQEKNDRFYSHGRTLTRLSIQSVIKSAVSASTRPLPVNPRGGLYLLLTAADVAVQDFCGQVCGFHYFTFPSIVGYTLPYAWVGNSATQCPGVCAYPFAVPAYIPGLRPAKPPNGDVGVDGMVTVVAHELAELATNPLVNAWYAGEDPCFPQEIADLCEGIYGTGGGGSYMGQLQRARDGSTYNVNGLGRRFLVQWVWHPVLNYCYGPNAMDQ